MSNNEQRFQSWRKGGLPLIIPQSGVRSLQVTWPGGPKVGNKTLKIVFNSLSNPLTSLRLQISTMNLSGTHLYYTSTQNNSVQTVICFVFGKNIWNFIFIFHFSYVPSWTYTAVFQPATLGHPGVQDPVIGLKRSDSGAWFRDFEKDLGLVLCSLFEPFGTLCFQLTQK